MLSGTELAQPERGARRRRSSTTKAGQEGEAVMRPDPVEIAVGAAAVLSMVAMVVIVVAVI